MKIVVFGPRKRTGVLHGDQVVDLNYAVAKFLKEKQNDPRPLEMAEALASSNLLFLIEGGRRALDAAKKAIDYLFGGAQDQFGPSGERIVYPLSDPLAKATRAAAGQRAYGMRRRQLRRSHRSNAD